MNNLIRDLKEITSDGEALIYYQMVPQPTVNNLIEASTWKAEWILDEDEKGQFYVVKERCLWCVNGDGLANKTYSDKCYLEYNIGDLMWADDGWKHDDPSEDCVKFSGHINKIDVVEHRGKYCWAFWCQEQPVEN